MTLKRGQAVRYDLNLPQMGRVEIDVRAEPVPVSVKVVSTRSLSGSGPQVRKQDLEAGAQQPLLLHQSTLTMTKVVTLERGAWTVLIERSEDSDPIGFDTEVRTKVTAF